MSRSRQFLTRLGLQYPIIQAPMAGVGTPELAAAVSNAGALGSIAIGATGVAAARRMIDATRAMSSRPFNVNVFCHAPARRDAQAEAAWIGHLAPLLAEAGAPLPSTLNEIYRSFNDDDSACRLLLELRPAVVSFHFGLPPRAQIAALKQRAIYTMATATSLEEGVLIEDAGVDAIVAQGIEAGGHRGMFEPDKCDGQLGTADLVRQLVQHTALPTIAAGGIMDGAAIRAALDLGAAAAQLGTAFVLCPESSANAAYRAMLQSEAAALTTLTSAISGRPARGIVNRLTTYCEGGASPRPPDYPLAYDLAKQLHAAAAQRGNHAFAAHWAGQGAALARAMPAAQLVRTLAREMLG